jgi:hypothetical protein
MIANSAGADYAPMRNRSQGPKGGVIRPDRRGKRLLATHVSEDVARAIKVMAAENLTTTGALLNRAIELLFNDLGKPLPPSLHVDKQRSRSNQQAEQPG